MSRAILTIITLSVLLVATTSILIINADFKNNEILNPDRTTYNIPDWVKHNAYWWGKDMISDTEYAYSIEYMINEGIISIKECIGNCVVNSTGD